MKTVIGLVLLDRRRGEGREKERDENEDVVEQVLEGVRVRWTDIGTVVLIFGFSSMQGL